MKSIITVLLLTIGISVSAGVRSAYVTTLEKEIPRRHQLLVTLNPMEEKVAPNEIHTQSYLYSKEPITEIYDISSINKDACGNTIYSASRREPKPKVPEYHFEIKLVDYSDRICFIHREYKWEVTLTFRDDLNGIISEVKFFGLPTNVPNKDSGVYSRSHSTFANYVHVNGNDLSCRNYIGGSKIVLTSEPIEVLGLKRQPFFSTLANDEDCEKIRPLLGAIHRVPVFVETSSYEKKECITTGSFGCNGISCNIVSTELARMIFSNGLQLQSKRIFSEKCK